MCHLAFQVLASAKLVALVEQAVFLQAELEQADTVGLVDLEDSAAAQPPVNMAVERLLGDQAAQ